MSSCTVQISPMRYYYYNYCANITTKLKLNKQFIIIYKFITYKMYYSL